MKRRWNVESAKNYIAKAESGKAEKGLKYWSAKDYLRNHKPLSKHSIIGI